MKIYCDYWLVNWPLTSLTKDRCNLQWSYITSIVGEPKGCCLDNLFTNNVVGFVLILDRSDERSRWKQLWRLTWEARNSVTRPIRQNFIWSADITLIPPDHEYFTSSPGAPPILQWTTLTHKLLMLWSFNEKITKYI